MTAFLCMATNNYNRFLPDLYASIIEYLEDVDLICFVNEYNPALKCRQIFIEHPPFPGGTLNRFEVYLRHRALWSEYENVYHIDADMLVCGSFNTSIPYFKTVPHWGYRDGGGPFCNDYKSTAYVSKNRDHDYVTAQFYGGYVWDFENVMQMLYHKARVDKDNGVQVQWHDETYLNTITKPQFPVGFVMPEGEGLNEHTRLIALVKDNKTMQQ